MRENGSKRRGANLLALALAAALASACSGNSPAVAASDTSTTAEESRQQTSSTPARDHSAGSHATEASVPRVTAEELHESLARGEVVVVDVRGADAYAAAHIPGSLHMPLQGLEARLSELPMGKMVVTYCT